MGRDLRRYRRQTTINLFIGFIVLLLVGGGGLVYLIYGVSALPTYLLCLGGGLAPLLLIGLALLIMQWIVNRSS
ncbi:MAG: hypothetical protein ACC647_06780 [Anaerolineales bacterium]